MDSLVEDIECKFKQEGVTDHRLYDRYQKELMSSHYGCSLAYDEAYEHSDAYMASALWRNVYMMAEDVQLVHLAQLTAYVRMQMQHIHSVPLVELHHGKLTLQDPPADMLQ